MSNELLNQILNELNQFDKEFLILLTLDLIEVDETVLNKIKTYKIDLIKRLEEDMKVNSCQIKEAEELGFNKVGISIIPGKEFGLDGRLLTEEEVKNRKHWLDLITEQRRLAKQYFTLTGGRSYEDFID